MGRTRAKADSDGTDDAAAAFAELVLALPLAVSAEVSAM
jgi:hypothetical protein